MKPYMKICHDGPYLVFGVSDVVEKTIIADGNGISVRYDDGKKFEVKSNPVALCRCGRSRNAPFCDNSHLEVGFDGRETASFGQILDGAASFEGKDITLMDNEGYCAFARFCDANGRIWNLVGGGTGKSDDMAVRQAGLCPAGRLIALDRDGNVLEDKVPPSIGVLEDAALKISGPLWVRGGIRIESTDGRSYEVRMRQTLCRCGHSGNKPFCDGAHAAVKFKARSGK